MGQPAKTIDCPITVTEFYRLVPDGQKADLLDGVIYMASPDKPGSDSMTNFIHFLILGFLGATGLGGEVFGSRCAFRLSPFRAPEPDVAFVSAKRLRRVKENEVRGAPDVAVEVVARDSRSRDYGLKKDLYEQAGVGEYWIIDPMKKKATFFRLQAGRYEEVKLERGHLFRSLMIAGFWMDVRWLFRRPQPVAYHCLLEILQGVGEG